MAWPFEIFGLDPACSPEALRREYARLLRTHRPDRDASGFQRLRAAYEAARAALEGHAAPPVPPPLRAHPAPAPPPLRRESPPEERAPAPPPPPPLPERAPEERAPAAPREPATPPAAPAPPAPARAADPEEALERWRAASDPAFLRLAEAQGEREPARLAALLEPGDLLLAWRRGEGATARRWLDLWVEGRRWAALQAAADLLLASGAELRGRLGVEALLECARVLALWDPGRGRALADAAFSAEPAYRACCGERDLDLFLALAEEVPAPGARLVARSLLRGQAEGRREVAAIRRVLESGAPLAGPLLAERFPEALPTRWGVFARRLRRLAWRSVQIAAIAIGFVLFLGLLAAIAIHASPRRGTNSRHPERAAQAGPRVRLPKVDLRASKELEMQIASIFSTLPRGDLLLEDGDAFAEAWRRGATLEAILGRRVFVEAAPQPPPVRPVRGWAAVFEAWRAIGARGARGVGESPLPHER